MDKLVVMNRALAQGLCSLFLSIFSSLLTHPYDAIINLGGDCQVAYQLRQHGLRSYALPFDILITPFDALFAMLKNRFDGFLAPENFQLMTDEKGAKYVLDIRYGSRLMHDFKLEEDFLTGHEAVADKYARRIVRLMQLIVTSNYPLFIRKRITQEQAVTLRDQLALMREGRPFVLVALDGSSEAAADWNIPSVQNYLLRQPEPYVWQGDTAAWKEIFDSLGLEPCGEVVENKTVMAAAFELGERV